ncbi:MAG: BrnA antitoxin family protein [Desulfobacterales bacterium]|nr:BrnA antitoxin family protein [Desulfobacterales bacterium]
MKQNITLSLDRDFLKKVKVLAAKRDISVTRLLAEELTKIVHEDDQYESSKRRALARLKKGFHLGGLTFTTRDELHEQR